MANYFYSPGTVLALSMLTHTALTNIPRQGLLAPLFRRGSRQRLSDSLKVTRQGRAGQARIGILGGCKHILGPGFVWGSPGRFWRKTESDTGGRSLRKNVPCRGTACADGPGPKVTPGQGLLDIPPMVGSGHREGSEGEQL